MNRKIVSGLVLTVVLVGMLMVAFNIPHVNQVKSTYYISASADDYINVNVTEAKKMIESNPWLVILDVRTLEEYNEGHIENAVLIPVSELEDRLDELDSEKDTLVYCRSGGRSSTASQILVDNGFSSIYNMLGGITAWRNAGYWIEIIHEGDLVIDGTETFVIENCTYIQTGNIEVTHSAKVTIRNAILRMNQDYWHQFEFKVWSGTLKMIDSTVDAPKGSGLSCHGGSININQSSLDGMVIYAHDRANVVIYNCTSGRDVWMSGNSRVTVLNSYFGGGATLKLEQETGNVINGLKPGYIDYFELCQNQTAIDVDYHLTFANTFVKGWYLDLDYDVDADVSNSTIETIWIRYYQTFAEISGLRYSGYYTHLNIGKLTLRETTVSDFVIAVHDGTAVEIRNTMASLHLFEGKSNVSIWNSNILSFHAISSMGVLSLNNSTLIGNGVLYSTLYIYGNATKIEWYGDWVSTSVTREYTIIIRDVSGHPAENVELTLFNQNDTTLWHNYSDTSGTTSFNITFTDNNHTDALRLEAVKGNYSAKLDVSLLSATPLALTLRYLADLNGDGTVNILDIAMVAKAYGAKYNETDGLYWHDPPCEYCPHTSDGDLDGNGEINILDIATVAKHFGEELQDL